MHPWCLARCKLAKGKSSDWKVHHKSLVGVEPLLAGGRSSIHTTSTDLLDLAHETDFAPKKLVDVVKCEKCIFPRNNGGVASVKFGSR